MLADIDPARLLSAVLIAVVVVLATGIGGLYVIGLSERDWQEGEARDAGVNRPCYEAIRDSLGTSDHAVIVQAAQAIRAGRAGWPRAAPDALPCP